jgi:hypothetical protein
MKINLYYDYFVNNNNNISNKYNYKMKNRRKKRENKITIQSIDKLLLSINLFTNMNIFHFYFFSHFS